ncbi:hypothetical protein MN0502_33260 [Arthrobacter sp. MN05-02]|nr:hypothetical protein MN0502_33260 [Arthrobacter sp. MN05-02]
MAHLDVSGIDYFLSDGRQLLNGVAFKVGDGHKTALIGPNGTGKTTLLRIISGDLTPDEGSVSRSGAMGIMRQFVGQVRDDTTVRDLLVSAAPPVLAAAAARIDAAELAMMEADDEPTQMRYAQAIADWGDAGGYELETTWDEVTMAALGVPFDRAQYRAASSLSGGEQKRLVLEALFSGPDDLLLLDEPDNYLDVPGKRWLEAKLRESKKSVLFVSHDRELLANAATRIVTLEPGALGASSWTHGGGFETYLKAREDRNARFEESCASAGTRSTSSSRNSSTCTRTRRHSAPTWPTATTRRRPVSRSSSRPGRRRPSPSSRTSPCACRAAARPSGPSWPRSSS